MTTFAADKIEQRAVASLIPYVRNARTHNDAQVAQIAASIREFGFTNPVLIDAEGGIIAGHGRLLAARKLGMDTVPCIALAHLSDAQRRAYILADNKLALNAGWDADLLALEIGELQALDFDIALTGFGDEEIAAILAKRTDGLTDPDAVPETPENPVTRLGDVWILGNHRIICGDSTEADTVARVLNGVNPHLMVTDPPYDVDYDPTRTSNNAKKAGKVLNDDRADWREAWALFPGDVAYVWHVSMHTHTVLASLEACKFQHRAMIVWAKDRFTLGRGNYHWQHELCWYVVKGGGDRTLERRSFAVDALEHKGARGRRPRPRYAKARRVHAPPNRKQLVARAGCVRAVLRQRHDDHRLRANREALLRHRVVAGLCRRGRKTLAGIHRKTSRAGKHRRAIHAIP